MGELRPFTQQVGIQAEMGGNVGRNGRGRSAKVVSITRDEGLEATRKLPVHSLALYSVRVKDSSLPGPREKRVHKLNDVRGTDLLEFLHKFANAHKDSYTDVLTGRQTKAYKFSKIIKKDRTLYGVIDYGEYGLRGKIDNIKTGVTEYQKRPGDSDVQFLYFCFVLPEGSQTGICAFQNTHGRGIKSLITAEINASLNKTISLSVDITPVSYESLAEEWAQGAEVKQLRLTKYTAKLQASEIADALGEHTTEIIFRPPSKFGTFGPLGKILGKKNSSSLVTSLGKECQTVKAVVEFNGRRRTFKLSSQECPVSNVEFDEPQVKMDEGQPLLESLHEFCTSLIDDILIGT